MTSPLQTEIRTARLLLRPLADADAPTIQRLLADERVSRYTASIPYPYPDGAAARFIGALRPKEMRDEVRRFAVTFAEAPSDLTGIVGLDVRGEDAIEIGYWLGAPYWGRGLMSEAVAAVAAFARRWRPGMTVGAHTFPENAASQRVLEKAGFARIGTGVCDAPARERTRIENAPMFVYVPADEEAWS
jgi:8-oxo-dGTP diphosphatase